MIRGNVDLKFRVIRFSIWGCVAAIILLPVFFISISRDFTAEFNQKISLGKGSLSVPSLELRRSLSDYLAVVSKRVLFRPEVKRRSVQKSNEPDIDDLSRDLQLVGFVSVDNKEAIVKNRRTRRSFFIKPGDSLGKLKVVDILEGKIIVEYKDESKELYLQ